MWLTAYEMEQRERKLTKETVHWNATYDKEEQKTMISISSNT